jgi:hypothetical protein
MRWHLAPCNHFFFASLCKSFAKEVEKGRFWLILALHSDSKTSVRAIPVSLEVAPKCRLLCGIILRLNNPQYLAIGVLRIVDCISYNQTSNYFTNTFLPFLIILTFN